MYAPTFPLSLVGLGDHIGVTRTCHCWLFEKLQGVIGSLGRLIVHPGKGGC